MNESLAQQLEEAATLSTGSSARQRIEERILKETEVTNFAQMATFTEVLSHWAAGEIEEGGDESGADAVLANAQIIVEALNRLHEVIQEMA